MARHSTEEALNKINEMVAQVFNPPKVPTQPQVPDLRSLLQRSQRPNPATQRLSFNAQKPERGVEITQQREV